MNQLDLSIDKAIRLLNRSRYAVALTGAGISTPSGIPDFRSSRYGLWEQVDPMEVATIMAFKQFPERFYNWIRPLLRQILDAHPNPAHIALAHLEQYGPLRAVITQNIDMLHAKAGSRNICELHGHLRLMSCLQCMAQFEAERFLPVVMEQAQVPRCPSCGGLLKPDVVLFGELLPMEELMRAEQHVRACDLMLVAGSSLEVSPAGDLPWKAKQGGASLIIVNLSETHLDYLADVVIRGDVAEMLPRLAEPFLPRT